MELSNNSLALIALCNEYCAAVENAERTPARDFVASMLRLLPRIYICATDLLSELQRARENAIEPEDDSEAMIESYLTEEYYDSVRRIVGNMLGPDDTYLEVFEEDMKYSDTPIAMSVAEGIADLFQVYYNFVTMVRDAPSELVDEALTALAHDFQAYWGQRLCNLMRPLNQIGLSALTDDPDA